MRARSLSQMITRVDRPREGDAQQDREQRLHSTALEDTGSCRMLLNMPI